MKLLLSILGLLIFNSCEAYQVFDLAVENAKVFDTNKGVVLNNKTILINADTIADVINSGESIKAKTIINAHGKLVTPGIIDAHIHLAHYFGDYEKAPLYLSKDSIDIYRKMYSEAYLPYGVTAVMVMGEPEPWIKPTLEWSTHPLPAYTDIYTVGGDLISKEDRKPYINHITVNSPLAAKQKIIEYYDEGIRHIKLYWRLRLPEFEAAIKTADGLGMRAYGHIDGDIMFMDTTLMLGLKNYEHLYTIIHSLSFTENDNKSFVEWQNKYYGKDKWESLSYFEMTINEVRWCIINKLPELDSLIDHLARNNATFSITIHLFAEKFGIAYFSNPNNKPDSGLTNEQVQHNADNFKALMLLAKKVYDKGIKIRIGTDCPNGGKAALSEQLLLAQYGFTIPSIIQISTINGATALGMENKYGSIEKGKKADLIIYDQSPFDNYRNFLSTKTIIKDGVIYHNSIDK